MFVEQPRNCKRKPRQSKHKREEQEGSTKDNCNKEETINLELKQQIRSMGEAAEEMKTTIERMDDKIKEMDAWVNWMIG